MKTYTTEDIEKERTHAESVLKAKISGAIFGDIAVIRGTTIETVDDGKFLRTTVIEMLKRLRSMGIDIKL